MTRRRATSVAVLLSAALLAGCGGPGQPPTRRVTGMVFIGDRPAAGALVVLVPTGGFDPAADNPRGLVGDDGSFAISTYADGDGAPPGDYKVMVLPPAIPKAKGLSVADPAVARGERAYERYRSPESTPLAASVADGPVDLGRIVIDPPGS